MKQLPQYVLHIAEKDVTPSNGSSALEVELLVDCGLKNAPDSRPKKPKGKLIDMTAVLTLTSDLDFVDFRRIPYVEKHQL